MEKPTKRILSGVQPSGDLHLGNYLGAIKNFVTLQKEYECFFCVVDLHAITVWQDPKVLANKTREVTAAFIASGIDPNQNNIFVQSQVPQHAQLGWLFNCVARMGWLNRMTQFKDKAGKNSENVSVGLFSYPTLMAADILIYLATHVPVGDDQKQHLELTRDIAQKFNSDFDIDFFPIPEPLILGKATRVMSLRDGSKKMSKSDSSDMSRINVQDDNDLIALKIRKARTDQEPIPENISFLEKRPEAHNLVNIYASLTNCSPEDVLTDFSGKPFSYFKPKLVELLVSELEPISKKIKELLKQPEEIDTILNHGAASARTISDPIIRSTYEILGLTKNLEL